jgi:integrase
MSKSTRRLRYAQLKAFYNFAIEKCAADFKNPCSYPLLSKAFRAPRQVEKKIILDKEVVEEMIYNVRNKRDRLILELQARCGLRIGELLKIKVSDVSERKILLREPKSGKDTETAFMPEQIARRLSNYIRNQNLSPNDRIFPITYATARNIVKRQGAKLKVTLTPHDLRRYSATYASRNGVPLEIISKIILRHQDLKTTQVYLGKKTANRKPSVGWTYYMASRPYLLHFQLKTGSLGCFFKGNGPYGCFLKVADRPFR